MLRTPLYDWHVAHGGRMVEFGGWEMPVQYSGIVDEHHAVRKAAGLFDISHMGRLRFTGLDSESFLDRIVTCDVTGLKAGQVRYGLICKADGGILDDILVSRVGDTLWLVVNASNREKIVAWLNEQKGDARVSMVDETSTLAMIAVQGPQALSALAPLVNAPIGDLKYYTALACQVIGVAAIVSRTGYTGEDGFEVILPNAQVAELCDQLAAAGVKPSGLGARDTLRLEAAMPLYGHELSETQDPLTAGLSFAVKLTKPDFIGKSALAAIATQPKDVVRVGLKLGGKRIAREGSSVIVNDHPVGQVTSGTFSPTLEQPIAMAYLPKSAATAGASVEVDVRGKRELATLCELPFYARKK